MIRRKEQQDDNRICKKSIFAEYGKKLLDMNYFTY